eukprot:TRINITY_DN23653_c0_g1_i1.p3 TRINITY_DN23653_c0_g1~~TRINITY_DN23653_c0_g1_i1.p3  ORF type:complete len:104 (-),score=4.47 TRINITY_DN23653_c0_g1_i1:97-408(-)
MQAFHGADEADGRVVTVPDNVRRAQAMAALNKMGFSWNAPAADTTTPAPPEPECQYPHGQCVCDQCQCLVCGLAMANCQCGRRSPECTYPKGSCTCAPGPARM